MLIPLTALAAVAFAWAGCAPSGVSRSPAAVTQVRLAPPLSPNAFVLEGDRGPIVVDLGPAGDAHARRLDAALGGAGYRPSDVALVVLAHGHADHAGGAARLQALGATVVAGAGDLGALRAGQSATLHDLGLEAEVVVAGDLVRGGYSGGLIAPSRPVTHYFQDDEAHARGNVRALLGWGARRLYVWHGGPLEADRLAAWAGVDR